MNQPTNRPRSREPAALLLLLWALLWLVMWFWAIVGPLFVVLGSLSFVIDLGAIGIGISGFGGEPVRTTWQKLTFMAFGAALGVVGIGFLWLRRHGWLKYGAERDEGLPAVRLEVGDDARAHFTPGGQRSDTEAIKPPEDGVREDE